MIWTSQVIYSTTDSHNAEPITIVWEIHFCAEHFHWALVTDIWNLICSSCKLNKCDLLVIHWINAHGANPASKVPAGVHSNRGNNLHVFAGTTVCWLANALLELFSDVCLSALEMLRFFFFFCLIKLRVTKTDCLCRGGPLWKCSQSSHSPASTAN